MNEKNKNGRGKKCEQVAQSGISSSITKKQFSLMLKEWGKAVYTLYE